ncbi:MAG: helix-turn-helix domain-containing protein [Planctomycetes bacterium]|nr:helix-turn-helix domain-containing protein [Planctomycetota bacterium]
MVAAKSQIMFTVEDLRQRFGVTEATILTWIHAGELKAINVGRHPGLKRPRWRVTQAALDAFEEARTPTATPIKSRPRKRAVSGVIEFYPVGGKAVR